MDMELTSKILESLILTVLIPLLGYGVQLLLVKIKTEKSKLNESQMFALDVFVKTVVYAAEQLKVSDLVDNKLDYATDMVQTWLNQHNIRMDAAEVRARIEAAVKEQFNKYPPLPYE